jgi:phage/plasmid-like protein (TIGR03299 family)
VVKITRRERSNNLDGPVLPWRYAQTSKLQALLRDNARVLAAEVNDAAGLSWHVYQAAPFFFVGGDPALDDNGVVVAARQHGQCKLVGTRRAAARLPDPDYYFNIRGDTDSVIGIVKKRYRIVQNGQAPSVLDQLVIAGDLRYEAAGALHGGSQIWWLARLVAPAGDDLQTHLLLTNSHDGSTSLTVAVLSVHTATQTTLAWPLPRTARTLALRHTDSAKEQALEAQRVLELASTYRVQLLRAVQKMSETLLTEPQFTRFTETLVPTPKPVERHGRISNKRGSTMAENTKDLIRLAYLHNETLASLRGTLFGALLACQLYSDHMTINRNTPDSSADENRFKRLTGENNLGAKALNHALELLP